MHCFESCGEKPAFQLFVPGFLFCNFERPPFLMQLETAYILYETDGGIWSWGSSGNMAEEPSKKEIAEEPGIDALSPTRLAASDSSVNSKRDRTATAATEAYKAPTKEPAPSFAPFEVKDRYVIEKHLGSGSFGSVYEARDKTLDRKVAFKVAQRDQFASSDGRNQFLEEARASAKIRHTNVVSVFDTGEDEHGNPYVVLEYIDGATLDQYASTAHFFACRYRSIVCPNCRRYARGSS